LSLTKRQMENLAKSETAKYGSIRIGVRPATAARLAEIDPLVTRFGIKPECEATAICQGGVILKPVTGAVFGLGFLFGHTLR
jgi:hypothetical protein